MTSRKSAITLACVFAALALVACGGEDDQGSTAQDPADLEGKSWVLTQMLNAAGRTEIVDVGVNAMFDGTTISGTSGCNRYNASYEAKGDEISFGPISGTKKVCPEPAGSTETRYLQLLEEIGTYEISGRSMSMTDASGTPVLQFMQG